MLASVTRSARLRAEISRGRADRVEGAGQRRQVAAGVRQQQAPHTTVEQLDAEELLERGNRVADRRGRHVQFFRRDLEAFVPRGRLEGRSAVRGEASAWSASDHE